MQKTVGAWRDKTQERRKARGIPRRGVTWLDPLGGEQQRCYGIFIPVGIPFGLRNLFEANRRREVGCGGHVPGVGPGRNTNHPRDGLLLEETHGRGSGSTAALPRPPTRTTAATPPCHPEAGGGHMVCRLYH